MFGSAWGRRPLVIGGMHRSGTSLTASLLAHAGLHVGDNLLGCHHGNALGHYEDIGFLTFHERALMALGLGNEGYTTRPCSVMTPHLRRKARRLVAPRLASRRPWGWKEPRTVLFLDFWRELLPEARHLFVFRSPWEVADSLYRRGDPLFAADPVFALHVWLGYNRLIVDFMQAHPDRCLLVEIGQVIDDPATVFAAVESHLGLPLGEVRPLYREEHFVRGGHRDKAALVRAVLPEASDLYMDMRRISGSTSALPVEVRIHRGDGDAEDDVRAWARRSRGMAVAQSRAAAA